MAKFTSLPQELINHIVYLVVEDAEALESVNLRRYILVKLALVSKAFVLPSQRSLWAIMSINDLDNNVMKQLDEGFAKDFVIERFSYAEDEEEDSNSGKKPHYKLSHFLENVKAVIELVFPGGRESEKAIPNIFHIPSTRHIRDLGVFGCQFGLYETEVPTLRSLEWCSEDDVDDDDMRRLTSRNPFFQLLEEQAASSITSFTFANLSTEDYQINFSKLFKIHGGHIRTLKFGWVDLDIIMLIFPQTPSLKHLRALAIDDLVETCMVIQYLPRDVQLRTLELPRVVFPESSHSTPPHSIFLVPLLNLPQIQHLKKLIFASPTIPIDFRGYKHFKKVKKDLRLRYHFYIEQCRTKGIELTFWNQQEEWKFDEIEKQTKYEVRHEVLYDLMLVHI